jgi:coenzyme F420-reducing hydrogenase alpha subunit
VDFGAEFVIAIIAISTGGWIITSWIRARHGYPIEGEFGGLHERPADEATKALASENQQLKATVGRLEERMKVLERIATDPTRRLDHEIEELR